MRAGFLKNGSLPQKDAVLRFVWIQDEEVYMIQEKIQAKGIEIAVLTAQEQADYISLTDIAKYKSDEPNDVIRNWMRVRETIEYLGLWEQLNNPDFNPVEFDGFRTAAGSNAFTLSPQKWIKATHAIGIMSKSGRYGGTFAHTDIAFEFASWLSPEFKLYIIKDYQRLKSDVSRQHAIEWTARRALTKMNYRLHTDAVKSKMLPGLTPQQINATYANEADMFNIILFGQTAQEWRSAHPETKGNIRDEASLIDLLVLANLESLNAELLQNGLSQAERMNSLRATAIRQRASFERDPSVKRLEESSAQRLKK